MLRAPRIYKRNKKLEKIAWEKLDSSLSLSPEEISVHSKSIMFVLQDS